MSIIYKYPIELDEKAKNMYIEIHKNAKIFSVVCEDIYTAYVYAIVDLNDPLSKEKVKKEVLWLGTDCELTEEQEMKIAYYTFFGSFNVGQNLTWHFWIEPHEIKNNLCDIFVNLMNTKEKK